MPQTILLILGSGNEREKLEKMVQELEIDSHVRFLGRKDNVENWLQIMDVFVMPSFSEAFPIALIEAETAGLKCLCSESITRDAALTEDVSYLPIDNENLWVEEILKYQSGYKRENNQKVVEKAGYEVQSTIHLLEKEYLNCKGVLD